MCWQVQEPSKGWEIPGGQYRVAHLLKLTRESPRFWLLLQAILLIFYPVTDCGKKKKGHATVCGAACELQCTLILCSFCVL